MRSEDTTVMVDDAIKRLTDVHPDWGWSIGLIRETRSYAVYLHPAAGECYCGMGATPIEAMENALADSVAHDDGGYA